MKLAPCRTRLVAVSAVFMTAADALRAHPGHDGHELTWDFGHLAAHLATTFGWVAIAAAAAWAGWRIAREYRQSLRGSQVSRGK